MASTTTAHKALARAERRMVEYDSDDALNLVDLATPQGASTECLPIANFRRFVAGYFRSVGTGTLDNFQIIAATSAAGAGAVVVAATSQDADAIGDFCYIEADVEQIREVLAAATHVGVRVQHGATDEAIISFERCEPFYPVAGLTADYIS